MLQPKQIIYPISYFNYFKSFFFETKSYEKNLIKKITKIFNINKEVKLLGRARSGIYLAIKIALKYSKNNNVLLSPYTIPEVVSLVIAAGGIPIFIDHEKKSIDLKISELNKKIKKKPSAVLITHYHVNQRNYKKIYKLCKKYKVFLVEDCAISYSGKSNNLKIGSLSDFSIYSFSSFKFINFFYGGALAYKKKYNHILRKETLNWKNLKPTEYYSKFINTLKFDILTNKFVFNFFTANMLKLINKQKPSFLDKKNYLKQKFKFDKTYFTKPSDIAIKEIYEKTSIYKIYLNHRQKIAKIYYKNLKKITIPKYQFKSNFFKNNEFIHFIVHAKNKQHRDYLKKQLLKNGFDVGGFFYPNCEDFINTKNKERKKNIDDLKNIIITLPTHPRITKEYAEKLSKNLLKLY